MLHQRPIIGVMGSGEKAWEEFAKPLGQMIADFDYHLLTGAGGGAMTSVAKAFTDVENRKGVCIGMVPTSDYDGKSVSREKYPNPYIEVPILTLLGTKAEADTNPYSRNYVNVMSSNALVILPGDHGTQTEASLAMQYRKDMILFGPQDAFAKFPQERTRVSDIQSVQEFLQSVQANFRE